MVDEAEAWARGEEGRGGDDQGVLEGGDARRAGAAGGRWRRPEGVPRELRARELRDRLGGLDEFRAAQVVRGLVEADKATGLEAVAAVVLAPVPVPELSAGRLEELARRWYEVHEPARITAAEAVEGATVKLGAAVTRARRGLGRRMGKVSSFCFSAQKLDQCAATVTGAADSSLERKP